MTLSNYTTLKDIAEKHRINYYTLRRRVLSRKLRIKRIGTTILVRNSDVARVTQ